MYTYYIYSRLISWCFNCIICPIIAMWVGGGGGGNSDYLFIAYHWKAWQEGGDPNRKVGDLKEERERHAEDDSREERQIRRRKLKEECVICLHNRVYVVPTEWNA